MKEASFYFKTKEPNIIRCKLCQRNCLIKKDAVGFCGVRRNENGKLYSLVYAKPSALQIDPIEKKPFFHFKPKTTVLGIGTAGCNFRCAYCCNYLMSQAKPGGAHTFDLPPEKLISMALKEKCQGIAYTYNEPTIYFEYARDSAEVAAKKGLYNVFVTNGAIEEEPLKHIKLDAAIIDFKGFNELFYKKYVNAKLEWVKNGLSYYVKRSKAWIEVSNLIIPGLTDNTKEIKEFCEFVADTCGLKTPLHFIRFYPSYKMMDVPQTPVKTIHKAIETAKKTGFEYVYSGNIPGDDYEHTYCPNCNEKIITRQGLEVKELKLKNNRCPSCNQKISIIT